MQLTDKCEKRIFDGNRLRHLEPLRTPYDRIVFAKK